MMDKKESRLRRARQTRARIRELRVNRLTVFRSNQHIYASVIDASGDRVLVTASTVERLCPWSSAFRQRHSVSNRPCRGAMSAFRCPPSR